MMYVEILVYSAFQCLLLVVFHCVVIRVLFSQERKLGFQSLTIKLLVLANIISPLVLFSIFGNWTQTLGVSNLFVLFSYLYFHFFNMSLTSRRIHLLICNHLEIQSEEKDSAKVAVENRLSRLKDLGQICEINKKYYIEGWLFLNIGKALSFLRLVLLGKQNGTH